MTDPDTPIGPGTTPQQFADRFLEHLHLDRAVDLERAGRGDVYSALAHSTPGTTSRRSASSR